MKERPILFSGAMVRAILAGTKTQTRRVVKPRRGGVITDVAPNGGAIEAFGGGARHVASRIERVPCPYGQPGDRLWVRETWAYHLHAQAAARDEAGPFVYAADAMAQQQRLCDRWRPSIHMPRAASRLVLEVTGVRVEQLQSCSRADAIAEGVDWSKCPTHQTERSRLAQADASRLGMAAHYEAEVDYVGGYRLLWESINGVGSWSANPWVWVVEFRRAEVAA